MERAPLLRAYSTTSASFSNQNFQVYDLISQIRTDLVNIIDYPLSEEQLRGTLVLNTIIKPLENEYANKNAAVVYSLLVNRLYFLRIQSSSLSFHSINATRASLCEILAIRVLDQMYHHHLLSPDEALLSLANALVRCFSPFQGAPPDIVPHKIALEEPMKGQTSALEIAIVSHARLFIRSPAVQHVVGGIYTGQIVYAATSFVDILPDHYKRKEITLYNPREAPILDHYRLKVPRFRQALETTYFLVLFILFFVVLQERRGLPIDAPITGTELWFIIYSLGLTLDKIASILEHGWTVFTANMWNGLDSCFCFCFFLYVCCLANGNGVAGHAILTCGAVLLFPRLAFVALSNNVLVLAIRAMMADFVFLMVLAAFCFLGFLYALWILAAGQYSVYDISTWMIWIWFGLDSTGLDLSQNFHPFWGPVLFVAYACLSTTLLLTVLVSILATRFADINRDAIEEYMFRRAVVVFEGIKSDAIFNYWPPINLLALIFLVPVRFLTTPRRFHSLNVLFTRISAGPILILIALYERRVFGPARSPSPIGSNSKLQAARGLIRFEARADVEALLNMFVENDRGLRLEPHISQPRHLSVSSMIEQDSNQKKRDNDASFDPQWQRELKQRLENIEGALLELSKQGRK